MGENLEALRVESVLPNLHEVQEVFYWIRTKTVLEQAKYSQIVKHPYSP